MQTFRISSVFAACCLAFSICAQSNNGSSFFYNQILDSLAEGRMRRGAIEQISIKGDGATGSDQKMLETLRLFASDEIAAGSNKLKGLRKAVRQLTLINCNWDTLPYEILRFPNLTDLIFVNCPQLHLQAIHDEMLSRRASKNPKDLEMAKRINERTLAMSFINSDWDKNKPVKLQPEIFRELQDLRFVNIKGLQSKLDDFFPGVILSMPYLEWLTIEDCGLLSTPVLDSLKNINSLRYVSLSRNFLTDVPYLPVKIKAVDLSYNLISVLPSPNGHRKMNDLQFLFLDCNLLDFNELNKVRTQHLPDVQINSFSFNCNLMSDSAANALANRLDSSRFATYVSYAIRYVDDFKVAQPDCGSCEKLRYRYLIENLNETQCKGKDGKNYTLTIEKSLKRISFRNLLTNEIHSYDFELEQSNTQVEVAEKYDRFEQPRIDMLFSILDCNGTGGQKQKMTVQLQSKNYKIFIGDVPGDNDRLVPDYSHDE